MTDNEKIIHSFYTAWEAEDVEKMVSLYHPELKFEDPWYGKLNAERASNMWRMFNERRDRKGSNIKFISVFSDGKYVYGKWEAKYVLSLTGRPIHNKITGRFLIRDGKIMEHSDVADYWKWTRMAFGISGWLFGWTSFMRLKVQKIALDRLAVYEKEKAMENSN